MTMTVKLDIALERALRSRSRAQGRPASALIRDALQSYLSSTPSGSVSAFALGQDLFGRHQGPADLATSRKQAVADILEEKRPAPQAAKRARRG